MPPMMAVADPGSKNIFGDGAMSARPIRNLRWWIGGMLFLSTIINYLDRQTLSLLAPFLKLEYHWTNTDYANILIGFRVGYSLGQTILGRMVDRIGTRRGLSITVVLYSLVASATSLARGFYSFATFRTLLGTAESANWPGATKAVSEWFPKRERALATALFDSGSSSRRRHRSLSCAGSLLPLGMAAFVCNSGPAGISVADSLAERCITRRRSIRESAQQELQMIRDDAAEETQASGDKPQPWEVLLKLPQTWGAIVAKALTDPVWFFVADWFPIYLVAKGFSLKSGILAVWVPFIAADLGNFFGGAASGFLVKRGWALGAARKALVVFGGLGVLLLIPTLFTNNLYSITLLFALSTFSYASFSTIANVLPSDLFFSRSVATVSGLSGTGAGIGTIIAFKLIGYFSDLPNVAAGHSFDRIIVVAGIVPFVGMLLVLLLVRNTRATREGLVRPI